VIRIDRLRLCTQPVDMRSTPLTDQYAGYGPVLDSRVYPWRRSAGCVVHARHKFDELARSGTSTLAREALDRFGWIITSRASSLG
jgi:hypothetical protein